MEAVTPSKWSQVRTNTWEVDFNLWIQNNKQIKICLTRTLYKEGTQEAHTAAERWCHD